MNVCDLMGTDDGGKTALRVRVNRRPLSVSHKCRRHVVIGADAEVFAVPKIHHAKIRPANTRRVFQHFLEHRLQLA